VGSDQREAEDVRPKQPHLQRVSIRMTRSCQLAALHTSTSNVKPAFKGQIFRSGAPSGKVGGAVQCGSHGRPCTDERGSTITPSDCGAISVLLAYLSHRSSETIPCEGRQVQASNLHLSEWFCRRSYRSGANNLGLIPIIDLRRKGQLGRRET
jgi:hypothetical protein